MRLLTDLEKQLIDRLSTIHGKVRVAMESSGLHLYLDSPYTIREEGASAVGKLKASVNLDKWSGKITAPSTLKSAQAIAKWRDSCGYCHKTSRVITVSQLLNTKHIRDRIKVKKEVVMDVKDVLDTAVESPGLCIPVENLPLEHPAVTYLRSRGISVATASRMCRMSYCLEEAPETSNRRKRFAAPQHEHCR
jgi:hypothetical protein